MVLRTTVIAGFPGETEEEFRYLLSALREFEFDHLGAFAYSTEEGTPAGGLPDQLPEEARAARRDAILAQQRGIALRRNRSRIGGRLEVLVESSESDRGIARGRWRGQAPEIDGGVVLTGMDRESLGRLRPGTFVEAQVRGAGPYDLIASIEEGTKT
jgi:ribosomal protein S12 methylthiotransferase